MKTNSSTRRELPHWQPSGTMYFLTFRLRAGKFSKSEIVFVREAIKAGDSRYYQLTAVVVMLDHCHVLLRPASGLSLSRIVKGIKGATARQINLLRETRGSLWQKNYFDKIVRDQNHFRQCLEYMLDNPRKGGLVVDSWMWPGWFVNPDGV